MCVSRYIIKNVSYERYANKIDKNDKLSIYFVEFFEEHPKKG